MSEIDDDALSDREREILDMADHGQLVMIDMNSDVEVGQANRLLERGLIKTAGFHMDDDSPGLWTLVARVGPGETQPPYEPLVAGAHVHIGPEALTGLRTLKITRPLLNADEAATWATAQGFLDVQAHRLHVTEAYSRVRVDWGAIEPGSAEITVAAGGLRAVERLAAGAVALLFDSPELAGRHADIVATGASWDFPSYRPHVTLTYDMSPLDLAAVVPYAGPLIFGPERFAEV